MTVRPLAMATLVAMACAATRPGYAAVRAVAADTPAAARASVRSLPFTPPPSLQQTARFQHAPAPLDPAHQTRLRLASNLLAAGDVERARDSLRALDRELPHHLLVVSELARADIALGDDRTAASTLRAERAACRDSLLGSRDLAGVLERLAKPLDAIEVAIETWVVAPSEGPWAAGLILHLAPLEPRATTDALRLACSKRPQRGDMTRGLALLLSRQGRIDDAVAALTAAERAPNRSGLRRAFADDAVFTGVPADSATAFEALASVAGDPAGDSAGRLDAARRALALASARGHQAQGAQRVARALAGIPTSRWDPELLLVVSRGLREGGEPANAAELIARGAGPTGRAPALELERALDLAREGPPERAVPMLDSLAKGWAPARFPLAEAQFWAGLVDSALANYQRASDDTDSPDAMTALDRIYLLEEHPEASELRVLGTLAWERWRGNAARAGALADSLWRALPFSSHFYAQAACEAYESRAAAADWKAALLPLAAIADSLPGDRLAPLARQRAGETWLALGDDRRALAEFEECLARYPKAWNSPEVRRQVERLRKEKHL